MIESVQLIDLASRMIIQFLKACVSNFQLLSITHVYRENNDMVDSLSKEAISLPELKLVMEVNVNGEVNFHHEDLYSESRHICDMFMKNQ